MAEMSGAFQERVVKHNPYLSEKDFKGFMAKFSLFTVYPITKLALKFLILTFVRSGEVRGARWEEFDLSKNEWRIPKERMKMKRPHIVPLSKQAVDVLKAAMRYSGQSGLVFPSISNPERNE